MKIVLSKKNDKWTDTTDIFVDYCKYNNKLLNFDYIQVLYENSDIKKYVYGDIITKNDNIIFRNLCVKYLPNIREKQLPIIKQNLDNEAVFIEFRILPHIEFLIRNAIDKLGENWSHTIICGNINYESICEIVKGLDIKIIKLDHDNLNQATYSKLLGSLEFWNLIVGEKVLIHQEDSCIFKYNINEFLQWDYIGAPWNHDVYKDLKVGNGGFSLRSKSIMKQVINKIPIKQYKSKHLVYDKEMAICPEDVYFTCNMYEHKIGKIAPFEIAKLFSTESINEINSLGGHQFWLSDDKWIDRLQYNNITTQYDILAEQKKMIINYPNLFHKYLLNISNINDNISYTVTKKSIINKKLISHIHCYELEFLSLLFAEYINIIMKYFDIIVTYVVDNDDILNKYDNITFIKQKNYGLDIGGKFHVVDYLKNIDYSHIFFIHSKSNENKRKSYIIPFINNIDNIINNIKPIDNIFPNCFIIEKNWGVNSIYIEDITKYLNLPNDNIYEFIEGNCYILSYKNINSLYNNKLLYNILNNNNSFDYNWVNIYYKINNNNINNVYNIFQEKQLHGNNISVGLGWNGFADGMIEHVFERIIFPLCKKNNNKAIIVDNNGGYYINLHNNRWLTNTEDFSLIYHNKNLANISNEFIEKMDEIKLNKTYDNFIKQYSNIMNDNNTCINYKNKILVLIAVHCNNNIKHDVIINNLKYFNNCDVVIINSKNTQYKDILISNENITNYNETKNDTYLDFGKWINYIDNNNILSYKYIIFTNDSFKIQNSMNHFINLMYNSDKDLYGYDTSTEINFNIQSYLFGIKTTSLNILNKHFKNIKNKIKDYHTNEL